MSKSSLAAAAEAAAGAKPRAADTSETDTQAETKAPVTVESLRADHPDLIASIEATARAEGADGERARILGVEAVCLPGHEQLVGAMKADGKTTPEQAAMAVNKAERESGAARQRQALETMEASVSGVPAATAGAASPSDENTPEAWAAAWSASETLKAEFVSADAYVAYQRKKANGQIRDERAK